MKIKVMRAAFQDALKKCQSVVPAKTAMNVLNNVKVGTDEGGGCIVLTATDLDITESTSVPCEVIEPGCTTIPVRLLFAAVQKLPEGPVEISVDGRENAVVTAGTAVFRFSCISASEFPSLPADEAVTVCEIPSRRLAELFRKTSFAVSTDSTRRILGMLNLVVDGGRILAVATDGRRLSMCGFDLEAPTSGRTEILLSQKSVKAIQSSIAGEDVPVVVKRVGSQYMFGIGGIAELYTKTFADPYPNFMQVVPDTSRDYKTVTVDRELFLQVVDRVSIMSISDTDRLEIVFRTNEMVVSCRGSGSEGEARDVMPIKYEGPDITIAFNPDYVVGGVRSCDDDEVDVHIRNGATPMVISGSTDWMYVMMPLRTA